MTTLGHNVSALSVEGTFDDCQSMVKEAFLDRELASACSLTSANSINVARLIPQAFYYVHAARRLGPLHFVVPSGNNTFALQFMGSVTDSLNITSSRRHSMVNSPQGSGKLQHKCVRLEFRTGIFGDICISNRPASSIDSCTIDRPTSSAIIQVITPKP